MAKPNRQRLSYVLAKAVETAKNAEDIPLGSLAHSIAQSLQCTINLLPKENLSSKNGRAIRYIDDDGLQHFIMYEPARSSPGALDNKTRFSIAYELAHILLEHPPQNSLPEPFRNGPPPARKKTEDFEAFFMASVFLIWHGGPEKIKKNSFEDIEEVLTNIQCKDKALIMQALTDLIQSPPIDASSEMH